MPGFIALQQAGGFGVSIFFALSAYLITELLIREADRTGTIRIGAFFVRRMLRIWPLYFVALGIGLILSALFATWHFSAAEAAWFTLILGNFYVAAHGWPSSGMNVLWSLSIEEQFYLIIPSLTRFGGRLALGASSLVAIVAAYLAIAFVTQNTAGSTVNLEIRLWTNSLVNFQFFAAGTLIALSLHGRSWRIHWAFRSVLGIFALLGFVYAGHTFSKTFTVQSQLMRALIRYPLALTSTVACFLAVLGLSLERWKPVLYLGQISYGLYIFHDFVIRALYYPVEVGPSWLFARKFPLLADGLALLITIGIASVSYRYFEKPINKLKERFAVVKSGPPAQNA